MYQVKIEDTIKTTTEVTVIDGDQMIDENGVGLEKQATEIIQVQSIDINGDPEVDVNGDAVMIDATQPAVDVNGDPVMEPILNDSGSDNIIVVNKTVQELTDQRQVLIDAEEVVCQGKVDAYKAAQASQLTNGGPGPVADVEIMQIVNENNSQFEVIFK